MCERYACPECGDVLIHQWRRGAKESGSAIGQHIFDHYPHDFDWCDLDGVIRKSRNGILRFVEHKPVGKRLHGSQSRILPLMAVLVTEAIRQHQAHAQSGVFVVYADPPFASALVEQIGGPFRADLTGDELDRFLTGLPLASWPDAAA
jgi:hypothetical protein